MPEITAIAPIYCVKDIQQTADWYVRVLQFQIHFISDSYAILNHGSQKIHIQPTTDPTILNITANNIEFFIETTDLATLYSHVQASNPNTKFTELKTWPWGNEEFHIYDPNGALIRLSHNCS